MLIYHELGTEMCRKKKKNMIPFYCLKEYKKKKKYDKCFIAEFLNLVFIYDCSIKKSTLTVKVKQNQCFNVLKYLCYVSCLVGNCKFYC